MPPSILVKSDVDSIKAALEEEAGAYEVKEGVMAGKDIHDVVKDIID